MAGKVIPVKVALRCRPLIPKEEREGCQLCLQFIPEEPQVLLGTDKSFTYDYVFGPDVPQSTVYERAVKVLVKGLFKGYNATVLAYGQTGSGKTYSMGGNYDIGAGRDDDAILGIIPRVIHDLFVGIDERIDYNFTVKVSYLELYKEDLLDLLVAPAKREKDSVNIREDVNGGIKLTGMREIEVSSAGELITLLEMGAQSRTTGATAMNNTSSRSHAIFTIHIDRTCKNDSNDCVKAKFHLVDLAGSERVKKTHAEGDRFKEGININKGLLALGNVISALGEETQKRGHIPYRDSKLTRLLQDSLGGNSHTVMIACVSPADSNMEETLSTLRYADRARKIKNKPVINLDPQTAEINRLKAVIRDMMQSGAKPAKLDTSTSSQEESTDGPKYQALVARNKELQDEIQQLRRDLADLYDQNTELFEKAITAEAARDSLLEKLESVTQKVDKDIQTMNETVVLEPENKSQMEEQIKSLLYVQAELTQIQKEQSAYDAPEEESVNDDSKNIESPLVSPNVSFSDECQKQHLVRRGNMAKQLQELNKMVADKQKLQNEMIANNEKAKMIECEEEMKKMNSQIEELQTEREKLMSQLESAKANTASTAASKVAEQRRKRLQELESQMTSLKKKMKEKDVMLKQKAGSDKELSRLQQEIKAMKQQRVKLMKQMKEDVANSLKMQKQKDKEIMQLKAKERKTKAELCKVQQHSSRQQQVLKRKNEETMALNRRLKDALVKTKQVQEQRAQAQNRLDGNMKVQTKKWLNGEIELLVNCEEVRQKIAELIEDRKVIIKDLSQLKEQLQATPAKKKKLNESVQVSEEQLALRKEIKEKEQEHMMINAQIQEFQQQIMAIGLEEKEKTRWESVRQLSEARTVMKFLIEKIVRARVDLSEQTNKFEHNNEEVDILQEQLEAAKCEFVEAEKEAEKNTLKLKRYYEAKIGHLMNQVLSKHPDTEASVQIKKDMSAQQEVEQLRTKIAVLEKCGSPVAEAYRQKHGVATLLPALKVESADDGDFTPRSQWSRPIKEAKRRTMDGTPSENQPSTPKAVGTPSTCGDILEDSEEESEEEDLESECESTDRDPEWRAGFTPCGALSKASKKRRIGRSVSHFMNVETPKSAPAPATATAPEPESQSVSCSCKGSCGNKRCSCRKNGLSCEDGCGCKASQCVNREQQEPESTTTDEQDLGLSMEGQSTMNTTFVKEEHLTTVVEETSIGSSTASDTENSSVLSNPRKRKSKDEHAPLKQRLMNTKESSENLLNTTGVRLSHFGGKKKSLMPAFS